MVTTPGKYIKNQEASMSFYRTLLSIAGLCVLFVSLALPTSCSEDKNQFYQVKFACVTTINVTDTGVDKPDAYVCKNGKVTWNANNHIFFVFFKKDCPFTGPGACKEIDNQHPTTTPIKDTMTLTVYDYGIVVDGTVFDPHIIGGGN
jgi:hypothetical protein